MEDNNNNEIEKQKLELEKQKLEFEKQKFEFEKSKQYQQICSNNSGLNNNNKHIIAVISSSVMLISILLPIISLSGFSVSIWSFLSSARGMEHVRERLMNYCPELVISIFVILIFSFLSIILAIKKSKSSFWIGIIVALFSLILVISIFAHNLSPNIGAFLALISSVVFTVFSYSYFKTQPETSVNAKANIKLQKPLFNNQPFDFKTISINNYIISLISLFGIIGFFLPWFTLSFEELHLFGIPDYSYSGLGNFHLTLGLPWITFFCFIVCPTFAFLSNQLNLNDKFKTKIPFYTGLSGVCTSLILIIKNSIFSIEFGLIITLVSSIILIIIGINIKNYQNYAFNKKTFDFKPITKKNIIILLEFCIKKCS